MRGKWGKVDGYYGYGEVHNALYSGYPTVIDTTLYEFLAKSAHVVCIILKITIWLGILGIGSFGAMGFPHIIPISLP